jgi:hypothetical protein
MMKTEIISFINGSFDFLHQRCIECPPNCPANKNISPEYPCNVNFLNWLLSEDD